MSGCVPKPLYPSRGCPQIGDHLTGLPDMTWNGTLGQYRSSVPGEPGLRGKEEECSGAGLGTSTHPRSFNGRDRAPGPRTLAKSQGGRGSGANPVTVRGRDGGRRERAEEGTSPPRLSSGKARWLLAGNTSNQRILFCCYCYLHPSGLLSGQGCSLIFLSNPDCV